MRAELLRTAPGIAIVHPVRVLKSVLVVDDDLPILSLILRVLELKGHQVAALSDFAQAKDRLRAQRFDVLVVDVRLREFHGLQLAIQARLQDPGMLIVVMSAWDDADLAREAEACGAVQIRKPFTVAAFLAVIRAADV
jgi:two-component system response regulator PilR (NtrC family)